LFLSRHGILSLLSTGFPAVLSFTITSLALALADTIYFTSALPAHISSLVLTPLNLLRYNLSSDNLASHGLHPRYLHIVANWPMLFGAGLAIVAAVAGSKSPHERFWRRGSFFFLSRLSIVAHQLSSQYLSPPLSFRLSSFPSNRTKSLGSSFLSSSPSSS
jgi:hypothetical protein